MAELLSVLFFNTMRYSVKEPRHPASDRFVLSKVNPKQKFESFLRKSSNLKSFKGHAAPILYAAWAEAGLIPVSELKNLRKLDNLLEGHPTPVQHFFS